MNQRWSRLRSRAKAPDGIWWRGLPGRAVPVALGTFRLTIAAVVAYLLTVVLTEGALDLTGPLTALLVMQASAFSTLRMGVVRVGAVLSGVLVAIALAGWAGLTWWSLGAAIAASLLLARALRLGEQAIEVPISAMLILGVANSGVAGEVRVVNTLLGAAVGIMFNLIYPPAVPSRPARQAVLTVADAAAAVLNTAGEAMSAGPVTRDQAETWVDQIRAVAGHVASARDQLGALKDSRRLNARTLGTDDPEPLLATGLDTLEHCLLAARALFVVMTAEIPPSEQPEDPYGEELRQAFAVSCTMPATACAPLVSWWWPKPRAVKPRPNRRSPTAWRSSARPRPSWSS